MFQILKATQQLNRGVQELLQQMNSVLQYYELNGIQWPAEPSFPTFAGGVVAVAGGGRISGAPERILFKTPYEL
jgi:hypothetical protein